VINDAYPMICSEIQDEYVLQDIKQRIAFADEKAFRQLFDCYAPKLIQFALSIIKDKEVAMEIVHEVFVKIWKLKERTPHILNLKVYLYTAVKNTAVNYLSGKFATLCTESFDDTNIQLRDEDCPEQLLITAEIFKQIQQAVEQLPPRCKMIFKLVREDDLKYKEVAEILNISANTVDAQMVIAVKRISEKVKIHFDFFSKQSITLKKVSV
jgi:RNA polymerase sigma-70 factor (ECF subfamily)